MGIYANFAYSIRMDERAKLIKEAGFDCASLWWEQYDEVNELPLYAQPNAIRKAGLVLENIHAPFININDIWTNSRYAQDAVNMHKKWIDECAYFGIPIMVMHVTLWDLAMAPNDFGIENMELIIEHAEKKQVTVSIENVGPTNHVQMLLDNIDSPRLGFCYDSSHDWVYTPDCTTEVLVKNIHRLTNMHLSDNDQKEDRHWLPGQGSVDWTRIRNILQNHGYEGYLSLEVFPHDYEQSPGSFLQDAYASLQRVKY